MKRYFPAIAIALVVIANFAVMMHASHPHAPRLHSDVFKQGKAAGDRAVLKCDRIEYAFRWVPAGEYAIGSPAEEQDREDSEALHNVALTKGYWILETEVTQTMWRCVMGKNPSKWAGDKRPVDSIGLDEIDEFCAKLNERAPEGVVIQLTTEAQWEIAARAGDPGMYAGKELGEIAWFGDTNKDGGTHNVATKAPNAWGIYDMCGNLWEWCSDLYAPYKTDKAGKGVDAVDPTGATPEECPGNVCVDRGGCWDSTAKECRVANRGFYDHDRKGPFVGFRFVVIPK